ncbi:hypothetical protein FSARC_3666 [Fusarium sarcochroum]|uniref:2EXR domain-containing protein n=1 Tax=Fusarium sarcochroum TaxID=1208366 RepID=A0A8H4U3G9_9HYPO|nr:hypothetical protein FSARC_3666 [Fusarium sarcochroum]
MSTTFHRFSDLPRELRDEIWSFVIRPPVPGVNIFRFYRLWENNPALVPEVAFLANCSHQHRLSAASWEQYFDNADANCGDKDVSTYLIDAGLWTACKESRLVMEKQFRHCNSRCWHNDFQAAVPKTLAEKMCQGGFSRPERRHFSGDTPCCFTLFPCGDLFVLQGDIMDVTINLGCIHSIWPETSFLGAYRDIAIEYDPAWGVQMEKSIRNFEDDWPPIVANLLDICERCTYLRIWVIDHNLKRKRDATGIPVRAKYPKHYPYRPTTFYASDRKFVEVDLEQGAKNLDYWQYVNKVGDGDYEKSSIRFVDLVGWIFEDFASRKDGAEQQIACHLGLLGWDNL